MTKSFPPWLPRALLSIAFGLTLLFALRVLPDQSSAPSTDHVCAGTDWEAGWCEECGHGYLAGIPIPSQIVYDALDAHGHAYELDKIECVECRRAIDAEGFCSQCKRGYWNAECYFSQLSYQIARAEDRDPGRCQECLALRGGAGWCETTQIGWIGEVAIGTRADFEKAERAYRVLQGALGELERCELCAASRATDGTCPKCWIAYEDGRPTRIKR